MPASPDWYYLADRRRIGPFKDYEMRRMLADGTLTSVTKIWTKTIGQDWRMLRETSIWSAEISPNANPIHLAANYPKLAAKAGKRPAPAPKAIAPKSVRLNQPPRWPKPVVRSRPGAWMHSPTFVLTCLVFFGSGAAIHVGSALRMLPFAFVLSGWIVALCLHEFGHAVVAYVGGDRSVKGSGYLTLDPLRYADPLLSVVLPAVFMAMGGFAFPGGAVRIDRRALRGPLWEAAVSAAGPAATSLAVLACGLAVTKIGGRTEGAEALIGALSFLGFLLATLIVVNLLPVPGLDGFGILRPWLSRAAREKSGAIAASGAWVGVAMLLWIPAAALTLVDAGVRIASMAGIMRDDIMTGRMAFSFWNTGAGSPFGIAATGGLLVAGLAAMKLTTMLRDGSLCRDARRDALIGGVLLAAVMVGGALGYERLRNAWPASGVTATVSR